MDKNGESKLQKDLAQRMSVLGRKGSRARAESLTAAQRRKIAKKAAAARWSKSKSRSTKKGKATRP
ncbi:MAG TPA: hypothetical protein VNY51_09330 [Candidatus Dormibacteraeota bacterium]|nr:hypothetical protein [Candidatus Dormibacteraeota bacterium]